MLKAEVHEGLFYFLGSSHSKENRALESVVHIGVRGNGGRGGTG